MYSFIGLLPRDTYQNWVAHNISHYFRLRLVTLCSIVSWQMQELFLIDAKIFPFNYNWKKDGSTRVSLKYHCFELKLKNIWQRKHFNWLPHKSLCQHWNRQCRSGFANGLAVRFLLRVRYVRSQQIAASDPWPRFRHKTQTRCWYCLPV